MRKLYSIFFINVYFKNIKEYKKLGGVIDFYLPILSDMNSEAGSTKDHYFKQDIIVANKIFLANPKRHIDIGSRIDGFVAHVASFRQIEVFDIRNLEIEDLSNIKFIKYDFSDSDNLLFGLSDSISCLHAIEHFGLGRYRDSIDPTGYLKGLSNLIQLLELDGTLYLSFPIGNYNKTYFNAHRIFNPFFFINLKIIRENLKLVNFDIIDANSKLHKNVKIESLNNIYEGGCGIFTFLKIK